MEKRIKELLSKITLAGNSKTVYHSAITSSATVINGLLGVTFYILVARELGPSQFGILTVALTTLTLVADIATVGTDTGIVKFVGQHFNSDRIKALQFLKLGLEIKFFVGLIIFLIGMLVAPIIATNVLNKSELIIPLRLAIVGAFGMLLFSFATSALQSIQKFWTWGIVNILANGLRLMVIGLLIFSGSLNLGNVLTAYIACIFLGFFVGLTFLPNFFKVTGERSLAKEFFHYNKWIALFMLIAPVSSRLDTYLTTKFLSLSDVGIYGVATSLSAIGSQIVSSITTVVAPKLAGFDTDRKAIDYLKKLQALVIGLAVIGIIFAIPLSRFAIPILYGNEYVGSIAPFMVLIIAQAVFLISVPSHSSVMFYFSYPKLFMYISIVHMVIIGVLGWVLISIFGYMGAAFTVLAGNISNLIIPGVWTLRKFSSKNK